MVINRQEKLGIDLAAARKFKARLRREMRLGRRDFNVCLVDDAAIRALNGAFRNKPHATDVLSFGWTDGLSVDSGPQGRRRGPRPPAPARDREFGAFLGDVVISVETARRNARAEGHSTAAEIRWLVLHGLLHLLGMDHETDDGEMESLELELRRRLGLNGSRRSPSASGAVRGTGRRAGPDRA